MYTVHIFLKKIIKLEFQKNGRVYGTDTNQNKVYVIKNANEIPPTDFLEFRQSQLIVFNVLYFILITYPLHVSAHLQVDYIY
jgi:hypothetical protein